MLKKKVIASSINNLTDARYFAGWMVDVFVFNIDPNSELYINPQEIGVFQSWVEGPKFYLAMQDQQLNFAEKYLVDLNCQGIVIDYEHRDKVASLDIPIIIHVDLDNFRDKLDVLRELKLDMIFTSKKSIEDTYVIIEKIGIDNNDTYINILHQTITESEILDRPSIGFVLHGSPEEKVGYKSYDELDEIFEVLQDF